MVKYCLQNSGLHTSTSWTFEITVRLEGLPLPPYFILHVHTTYFISSYYIHTSYFIPCIKYDEICIAYKPLTIKVVRPSNPVTSYLKIFKTLVILPLFFFNIQVLIDWEALLDKVKARNKTFSPTKWKVDWFSNYNWHYMV